MIDIRIWLKSDVEWEGWGKNVVGKWHGSWWSEGDKSAQKSCLIGMFGQYIDSLDSTIMAWLADKSTELIVYARHGWPINKPPTTSLGKTTTYV